MLDYTKEHQNLTVRISDSTEMRHFGRPISDSSDFGPTSHYLLVPTVWNQDTFVPFVQLLVQISDAQKCPDFGQMPKLGRFGNGTDFGALLYDPNILNIDKNCIQHWFDTGKKKSE